MVNVMGLLSLAAFAASMVSELLHLEVETTFQAGLLHVASDCVCVLSLGCVIIILWVAGEEGAIVAVAVAFNKPNTIADLCRSLVNHPCWQWHVRRAAVAAYMGSRNKQHGYLA